MKKIVFLILFLIILTLLLSWFFPIVPLKRKVFCGVAPCPVIKEYKSLKDIFFGIDNHINV